MMFPDFLSDDAVQVAPRLLGCELIMDLPEGRVRARIVETEAYDESDAASHSYRGKTLRTEVMFGEAGHLYVYFTYGMHYCGNVVTGQTGSGQGVLIRAVEPLEGEEILATRRHKSGVEVTNGPAKWCQAFGITKAWNGHDLREAPLRLWDAPLRPDERIISTKRIGIKKAVDELRRFYIAQNPYISRS